jgi:starvation-inducible DNA-binding protein
MKGNSATQTKYPLESVTDLGGDAAVEISGALRKLLADVFVLYVKMKNFHWHMTGPHFRDYHLLLDDQATQVFAMTDAIAERARKLGGTTIRSISDISRHQRLTDNNAEFVAPRDMLVELRGDNQDLTRSLRATHELCERRDDVATASLIENWIDETERRTWFLSEIVAER